MDETLTTQATIKARRQAELLELDRCRELAYAALMAGDEDEYEKWMPTVRRLAKKYPHHRRNSK